MMKNSWGKGVNKGSGKGVKQGVKSSIGFYYKTRPSDRKTGRSAAYRVFVCQDEPEGIERFYALKNLPSVLGGAAFKEWLKDTFQHLGFQEEVPESRLFFPTAAEVSAGVCAHFQVTKEEENIDAHRGAIIGSHNHTNTHSR